MVELTKIEFNQFGESLGTRRQGEEMRSKIENTLLNGNKIIFDLKGIEVISNSFADECFAKLLDKFSFESIKRQTHFENANEFVSVVILKSFSERLKK